MARPFRYLPPPGGAATFLRPRLLKTLLRRFELRLVTIEAGAGVGKTTVLAQAIEENRFDPRGRDVWLSLEPGDSSASTLASSLLHALGRPAGTRRHATITDVCDAIWDDATSPICLVLDDTHLIEAGSAGAGALAQLLDEMPANGHLVLAGRSIPAIPRSRLFGQQRAVAVTEADLRFDDAEQREFADVRGIDPALLDGTAGWPALAELRAMSGAPTAREFLWEEVLAPLPEADRDAFVLVAAIGGGDREVIRAAVGGDPDIERLAMLPLCTQDGQGGLRPHALWTEIVGDRIDPATLQQCRRQVAEVLRMRGEYGPAYELLADAGDWDSALETLFQACNDQHSPPWPDVVARWRARIAPDLRSRPEVAYLEAYIARSADPWSQDAWVAFFTAIDAFRAAGDVPRAVIAEVRLLWSAWLRGDHETIRMIDRRMYPVFMGQPGEGVPSNLAMLADIADDSAALRAIGTQLLGSRLERRLRHFPAIHVVHADLIEGVATDDTARHAAIGAEAAQPIAPAAGSGWAILLPGIVAWARGRLDDALAHPVGDLGPRFSIAERAPALAFRAVRAAHAGQIDEAEEHAAALRAILPPGPGPDLLAGMVAVAEATIHAARGDEQRAAGALREHLANRALVPIGAGKAVLWFPGLPYLLDDRCREALEGRGSGAVRERTLAACRTLRSWRAGEPAPDGAGPALLADPEALLAALPMPQALELAVRAHEHGDRRARGCIEALTERSPAAVRDTLHRLADGSAASDPRYPSSFRKALATVASGLLIPPDHHIRISVMGPLRMWHGSEAIRNPDLARERVRQVLLAMVAFREIRRLRLGTLLWPDFDEAGVSANLRMTLSYVQALLEPTRLKGESPWFLRQEAGVLHLAGGTQLDVDAWEIEALLDDADRARAEATPSVELDRLQRAVQLWRGDYLEDVAGEDWAVPLRERFTERLVRGGVRAGELLIAADRIAEATDVAERVLTAEPWSEAAYRVMARARLAAGDRTGALRTLASCRRMLDDIGVDPEGATVDLERSLARG